jgi:uncharacterized protein YqeY
MTIQEKIDADIKEAMRAKEPDRLSALRMVKSALMNMAIEKHGAGGKLADLDTLNVIRKQIRLRQESVQGFEKGGRPDLAAKEKKEIDYLTEYLPVPLTESEIQELVKEAIVEVGATTKAQMGAVMKLATEKAAGRADGKALSQVVQRILS